MEINIPWRNGKLKVADNKRFLCHENGTPFFWLGDTGWLLFQKLTVEEAEIYLEDRRKKGYNVIQAVVLHGVHPVNAYGEAAFEDFKSTEWSNILRQPYNPNSYNYWNNMEHIVDLAAQKGLYIALVPMWGSIAKKLDLKGSDIQEYSKWLALRYKEKPNIIWINGGDIRGSDHMEVWKTIGNTIKENDPNHLMTFHPFGRTQSSIWFHDAAWLDFNMFQSGHRRYDQQTLNREDDVFAAEWKGEDNWRYVQEDYAKEPKKPTIDGEPSYEGIPQGLHDPSEPYWTADDCRRYAYWAVFAGAFGHTYGNNAVIQMHKPGHGKGNYGVKNYWYEAIHDPGSSQMQYLKNLILSESFYDRVPDQAIIAGENGEKYERLIATRGQNYTFIYTYTGRRMLIRMGRISGDEVDAWWYNPRDGKRKFIGSFDNSGVREFDPPGRKKNGNDWVLVLKTSMK